MGGVPYMSAKKGVGVLSAFYHERAPMSFLQRLDALKARNSIQQSSQQLEVKSLRHTTVNGTMSL